MRICILGGSGHIGRAFIPLLYKENHQITVVSRGKTAVPDVDPWKNVTIHNVEYRRRDEAWHRFIREIDTDVVIDIPAIDIPGTYREIQDRIRHYITFGCYRMYGEASIVPTPEEAQNQCEFSELAERYGEILGIQNQARADGVPFTVIVPTEIMGPGKIPINAEGNYNLHTHKRHAAGDKIQLPMGGHSLFAPVDVEDVARALLAVMNNPAKVAGEILNVGPVYAITLEKFVQELSTAFRTNIPLEYVTWDRFFNELNPEPRNNYIFRSHMAPDITKIRKLLQFEPMIAPEAVIERSINWMRNNQFI